MVKRQVWLAAGLLVVIAVMITTTFVYKLSHPSPVIRDRHFHDGEG